MFNAAQGTVQKAAPPREVGQLSDVLFAEEDAVVGDGTRSSLPVAGWEARPRGSRGASANSWCGLAQNVTHAANRLDQAWLAVSFGLATQVADVDLQSIA